MFKIFDALVKQRNLKYSDVAKNAGISYSTITDWKAGRYTPKQDKLQKIANYLDVSLEYLMTGSDSSETENNSSNEYYLNKETKKIAQEVFDNPDLRILFDAAQDAKPEDLKLAADMLKRMKGIDG